MIVKKTFSDRNVQNFVNLFSSKINNGLEITYRKETLENVRNDNNFTDQLKKECGIYYFIQKDIVKYVGRALPAVGLRSRILNQINAFGDEEWDKVIKDNSTEIAVYIFNDIEQWYFISALEHYLIEKLERPIFNKRY
ncbi:MULTISPECIES: hypothetical protein [unclassified Lysinibacillus]|uniref:hypothetical protein n=1 Tax=unclassified Lysinibacillus TaxID=2636778 RepID=UPI002556B941|nr:MULTISPECIES: hypothetical protein [unclassified Lysinibacillus]MDM5248128.1 hypothetical protein [Lysinibacillus sp. G4S2]